MLFVTYTSSYGGAERHLTDLLSRLDASAVEPVILCYGAEFYTERLTAAQHLWVRCVSRPRRTGLIGFLAYWREFITRRPDVVVFVNGFPRALPWYAYLAARAAGRGRIVSTEQLTGEPPPAAIAGPGLLNACRRLLGWRSRYMVAPRLPGIVSDTTVCVSNAVRDRLVKDYQYPEEKTVTVWNGVDVERYGVATTRRAAVRRDLAIGSDEDVSVCVARLVFRSASTCCSMRWRA